MANRDIKINLLGVDKTGKAFGSLNKSLQQTGQRLQTTGKNIRNNGLRMTAVATGPVLLLGKSMVSAFLKQRTAVAQMETGLARYQGKVQLTSKELQGMASELQKVSTFGDEEILEGVTNQFLTFGGVIDTLNKEQFQEAQTQALNLSTILGTDLKSSALQLAKALDDPKRQLSALRRSGIQFTEAQDNMIKSMVDAGKKSEAASLILKALDDNYKGIAKTAAENDPFGQMSRRLGDIKEQFGEIIFGYLQPFMTRMEGLVDSLENMDDRTRKMILAVAGAVATIGPALAIMGSGLNNIGKVFNIVGKVGILRFGLIGAAVIGSVILIRKHWSKIETFMTGLFEQLGIDGDGLGEKLINVFNRVKDNVMPVLRDIRDFFVKVWERATEIWNTLYTTFRTVWDAMWPIVEPVMIDIRDSFVRTWGKITKIFDHFKELWDKAWPLIKILAIPIIVALGVAFALYIGTMLALWSAITVAIEIYVTVLEKVTGVMSKVITGTLHLFRPFVSVIVDGINLMISAWNKLNNLWGGTDLGHVSFGQNGQTVLVNGQTVGVATSGAGPFKPQHGMPANTLADDSERTLQGRRFARGGTDYSGGLALVGEAGPELVDLPKGSRVTPAGQTMDMLGSGSRTINMRIEIHNQYDLDALTDTIKLKLAEGLI